MLLSDRDGTPAFAIIRKGRAGHLFAPTRRLNLMWPAEMPISHKLW